MSNYQDKEFKEIYSDIVKGVKTLTSKWDPSISDESDPGVVILKTFALFLDKINYKINYRNSQNSVREATDPIEARKTFFDLGYQIKKKKSATGNLSVRYIGTGEEDETDGAKKVEIPLFTQFSNTMGTQNYTSVRSVSNLTRLQTSLIKVQEGVPSMYSYEGKTIFSVNDLTTSLRLSIEGIEELSSNGVVICSKQYVVEEKGTALVSDWLNIEDNIFTAVETDNIFSIGHDSEGKPYIQFYGESLPNLKNGVGIWIISSSGSAGNVPKNTINRVVSTLPEGISPDEFVISHEEFSNGLDEESIKSARENYYNTFGINESLIAERDYSVSIPKILKTDLSKVASKALVTGVDGYHNFSEIVSLVNNKKDRVILVKLFSDFITTIYVNALKSSKNYYESFEKLIDLETENLIRKAFYKDSVVSNDLQLTNQEADSPVGNIYDEYLFDIADIGGTIIINSDEEIDSIKNNVVLAIYKAFGSENLTEGELLAEEDISKAVSESVEGVISASFYYNSHQIVKNIKTSGELTETLLKKTASPRGIPVSVIGDQLSDDEKTDIISRSILRGNLKLFSRKSLQIPPGVGIKTGGGAIEDFSGSENKKIKEIIGMITNSQGEKTLGENEFIQFYTKFKSEDQAYGFGILYSLQAPQTELAKDLTLSVAMEDGSKASKLLAGSEIAKGSQLYLDSEAGETLEILKSGGYTSSTIEEEKLPASIVLDKKAYKVTNQYILSSGSSSNITKLLKGSIIADGSTICPSSDTDQSWKGNGTLVKQSVDGVYKVYGFILQDGEHYLEEGKVRLLIQTGEDSSTLISFPTEEIKHIKISGFSDIGGLKSSGPIVTKMPDTYLQTSQQLTTLTAQKTELLSGNYKYALILDEGSSKTFQPGDSYILGENEHLIYSDSALVDFVDFGSGTLLVNEGQSAFTLEIENSYDGDITERMRSLSTNSLKIYNTTIISYGKGTKIKSAKNNYSIAYDWAEIKSGEEFTINDNIEYGSDYYYRTGLVLSTGNNNVLTLESGQKLLIKYSDGSESEIEGEKKISFSSPIYVNLKTKVGEEESTTNISSYSLYSESQGAFVGGVNSEYIGDQFYIEIIPSSLHSGDKGETIFNIDKKSYLLKLKIVGKQKVILSLVSGEQRNESGDGFIKVLNSSASESLVTSELTEGEYQIYVKSGSNSSVIRNYLKIASDGLKDGDKLSIESFIDLEGYNSGEIGYDNIDSVYNQINKVLGEGRDKVEFDFFYEPSSPLVKPLEPLTFYDQRHLLNRNLLTVIDLRYLWENLRVIVRRK